MLGAEILIYPTSIATLPKEDSTDRDLFLGEWQIIQRSHAISNGY